MDAASVPLKTFSRVLLILFACVGASGCGSRARVPAGRTVIYVWSGWWGAEGDSFQRLVDRFNREQRRIWVDNLGGVSDDTKAIRAIVAGDPPDVCFLWNPATMGPL